MTFYISQTNHIGLQWADWLKSKCGTVLSFFPPSVCQKKKIIFSINKKDHSQAIDLTCPLLLEKGYLGKILVYIHVLIHVQTYADLFQDLYSMLLVHLSCPRIAKISLSTWRKHRCSNVQTSTPEDVEKQHERYQHILSVHCLFFFFCLCGKS